MATKTDYIEACAESGTEPLEYENQTLSIGSEFLPACAVAVRSGSDATPEYWQWLINQLRSST